LSTPSQRTLYAYQGIQKDYGALQIALPGGAPATFPSGTTLSAVVWQGQNQSTLFTPTVAWSLINPITGAAQVGYTQGQFSVSFLAGSTTGLDPDGEYRFLLYVTDPSNVQRVGWDGILKILATPGSVVLNPPDLVTYDYCLGMLGAGFKLTGEQIDALPGIISSASSLLRLKCNERYFDLRTLTESYDVSLNGYVRLWQEPVQIVTRVQGQPNLALTVYNNSSSVQAAQVYFSFTGDEGGYGSNARTATGIVLNWVANGTPATQTLLFATYPTIGQLAAAINAVGSGWTAQVIDDFGSWQCTELTGGFIAQGCTGNDLPETSASFNVLTDLNNCRLIPRTPMLYVGQQRGGNILANRWGPGGQELWGDTNDNPGEVKVTYQAGFSTIPADVQNATVQLVKYMLELLKQELLLKSEAAGDYRYELSLESVSAMPKPVWEMIGARKYHYA
jgi:hypothetical protein